MVATLPPEGEAIIDDLETFDRDGATWVRFAIHTEMPVASSAPLEAPLVEMRAVKSSSGTSEVRPVIRTTLSLGGVTRAIDLTLTNRDEMGFSMLVGREGLRGSFVADPARSFVTGLPPQDGERAPFTATRLSDFQRKGGDATTSGKQASADAGLDTVLIMQVPLKQKQPARYGLGGMVDDMAMSAGEAMPAPSTRSTRSDVEQAVIGHGPTEGPFKELANLDIERDERFPVRVTVQFYKATSNGVVSPADIAGIAQQIDRVYADGDYVGSLVTDGVTVRPTEWVARPSQDARWARPVRAWHVAR